MENSKRITQIIGYILLIIILTGVLLFIEGIKNNNTNEKVTEEDLEIHLIDVGQSESILIVQNGHVMLVDTGLEKESKKVVKYIQNLGIRTIDLLIITHFHKDHVGGANNIIRKFKVNSILCYNEFTTKLEKKLYNNMIRIVKISEIIGKNRAGITMMSPYDENGDMREFNIGSAKIQILKRYSYINKEFPKKEVNNKSINFKLTYNEFSMIFMGDSRKEIEEKLLEDYTDELSSDVLKVGHHGSNSSTTKKFLDVVNPRYAVISAEGTFLPSEEVIERLKDRDIEIYRTDEKKDIKITVKKDNKIYIN